MKSRTSIAFCQRPVRNPAHGVAGAFDRLWGVMVAAMRSSPGTLVQARFPGANGVASLHLQSLERDRPRRSATRSTRDAHDVGVPPAYRRRTPDRFRQRRAANGRLVSTVGSAARAVRPTHRRTHREDTSAANGCAVVYTPGYHE